MFLLTPSRYFASRGNRQRPGGRLRMWTSDETCRRPVPSMPENQTRSMFKNVQASFIVHKKALSVCPSNWLEFRGSGKKAIEPTEGIIWISTTLPHGNIAHTELGSPCIMRSRSWCGCVVASQSVVARAALSFLKFSMSTPKASGARGVPKRRGLCSSTAHLHSRLSYHRDPQ